MAVHGFGSRWENTFLHNPIKKEKPVVTATGKSMEEKMRNDTVKVICYGQEKIWDKRDEALRFYLEGMSMSEGSERERYENIYHQLLEGRAVCGDVYLSEKVREQILEIRDTGLTNMLDIHAVQRIAFEKGYYELVDYITENRAEYAKFIFTGKIE